MEEKTVALVVDAKEYSIQHDGRQRTYLVHTPKGWNGKDPLPVVCLFHGGGGSARQALNSYGLIKKSDEVGFLLVAPNGTGPAANSFLTWNVGFGFGEAQKLKIDDPGFVKVLLEKLEKDFPVDSRRLFATGMSNGGFLCHWLAAQPGNRFAAIAPVVAALGGREKEEGDWITPPKPTTPVSVLAINGQLDEHVPLSGGWQKKSITEKRLMMSASDTVAFWFQANQCASESQCASDEQHKAFVTRFSGGQNGTVVIQYVLSNQGHAWPGSPKPPQARADLPSPDFPGNDMIWEFFKAHPRPE